MGAREEPRYKKSESIIRILNALTSVSIYDFDDRMRLQKLAYLAREMGLDCGLAFEWYVKGPYSPSLTRILFAADELGVLRIENPKLSDSEEKMVQNLKRLLGADIEDSRALELMASVSYFLPKGYLSKESIDETIRKLQVHKPHFKRDEIEAAINRIVQFRGQT